MQYISYNHGVIMDKRDCGLNRVLFRLLSRIALQTGDQHLKTGLPARRKEETYNQRR